MPFKAPLDTQLLEIVGAGSVFEVALVHEAGRTFICKRLLPRARSEAAGRAAMVREARVLTLARHPAFPELVRVGSDEHGPFLLETRADGVSMRDLVEGWRLRGRRVPARLIRHIAHAAVEALSEIHELADDDGCLGIVHGDLSPEHLILGPLGQIRLVDFGSARFRTMSINLATEDRGTLPFAAPELVRGEGPPDAAADVYAMAATLIFLATGRPLLPDLDEAAVLVHVGEKGLRRDLLDRQDAFSGAERRALEAAVAFDPRDRIGSARELLERLSPTTAGAGST